jgi:hypothetical protein
MRSRRKWKAKPADSMLSLYLLRVCTPDWDVRENLNIQIADDCIVESVEISQSTVRELVPHLRILSSSFDCCSQLTTQLLASDDRGSTVACNGGYSIERRQSICRPMFRPYTVIQYCWGRTMDPQHVSPSRPTTPTASLIVFTM